jgi:hypothetical protein
VIEHPKSSPEPASAKEPIVFVIDDDASMRRALTNLFQSVGLAVQVFGSAPAACAIMLASVGTLSVPLTADAAGDAAAGEKIFAHSQREDQLTMETKLEQIAVKAVNQLPTSVVREIRTPRSVGAGGGRPPPATRYTTVMRCGSLLLHRKRLALSTPCRSPGASQMSSGLPLKADIAQYNRHVSKVRHPESCSAAFRRLGGAAAGPAKSSEFLEVERANSQSGEQMLILT